MTRNPEWPSALLGEIFSLEKRVIFPGGSPKRTFLHHSLPSFDESGGPCEQLGSEIESQKFLIDRPCVLVSKLNPRISRVEAVGAPRADGTEVASTEYMVFIPRLDRQQHVHIPFYAGLFESRSFRSQLMAVATGTTGSHTRVRPSETLGWTVVMPPLGEQRRVAEILDAVSAQERAIEASIAKLRSVRQGALLAAMAPIVCGEPPEGWARVPLKDVVPKAEYGVSEALDRDPRGLPVLRMNNLDSGRPELSDLRYSPVPVPERLELRRGDVLFNRTNSIDHVGKSGMWREEIPRASFASYLVRINPDASRLIPEYLVEWLMHPLIRQRVRSISTVAVQQVNVNPTRLRQLEIDMPLEPTEQRRIVDSLYSCDEQVAAEQAELNKLRTLKLGLMDGLLNGKA